MQPHVLDYWRAFDSRTGTELPQLTTMVEPHFNQLTLFDGRIPHGVRQARCAAGGRPAAQGCGPRTLPATPHCCRRHCWPLPSATSRPRR